MYTVLSVVFLLVSLFLSFLYLRLRKEVRNNIRLQANSKLHYDTYKGIVENLQDVYYRATLDGEVEIISESIDGLLGYNKEEMVGTLSKMYLQPGAREKYLKALSESDGDLRGYESQIMAKDGSLNWISVNAQYIYNEQHDVIGMEGVLKDISEKKEVEQQLNAAKQRLMELVK